MLALFGKILYLWNGSKNALIKKYTPICIFGALGSSKRLIWWKSGMEKFSVMKLNSRIKRQKLRLNGQRRIRKRHLKLFIKAIILILLFKTDKFGRRSEISAAPPPRRISIHKRRIFLVKIETRLLSAFFGR